MQKNGNETGMPDVEFIPPMATSGSRLAKMSGNVDVPRDAKSWVGKMSADFVKLDYRIQTVIIDILKQIRDLNPEEAINVGKLMGDYFKGLGNIKNPQELTDVLIGTLEEEKKKKIQ